MKIYLAGPYSGDNVISVLSNIRQGIQAAADLMRKGHIVYCPFLDFLIGLMPGEAIPQEIYQVNSLAWINCCDLLLLLPGWETSNGTKREIKEAESHGIPVTAYNFEDWS